MERLAEHASGLRHLRYAREIAASLRAFARLDPGLSERERSALLEEHVLLEQHIAETSAAVKAYRDFLERTRVHARAAGRVAQWLSEESPEWRDARDQAWREEERAQDERSARKERLGAAKHGLRAALAALEGRLQADAALDRRRRAVFPPVSAGGGFVLDVDDEDDDATGPAP